MSEIIESPAAVIKSPAAEVENNQPAPAAKPPVKQGRLITLPLFEAAIAGRPSLFDRVVEPTEEEAARGGYAKRNRGFVIDTVTNGVLTIPNGAVVEEVEVEGRKYTHVYVGGVNIHVYNAVPGSIRDGMVLIGDIDRCLKIWEPVGAREDKEPGRNLHANYAWFINVNTRPRADDLSTTLNRVEIVNTKAPGYRRHHANLVPNETGSACHRSMDNSRDQEIRVRPISSEESSELIKASLNPLTPAPSTPTPSTQPRRQQINPRPSARGGEVSRNGGASIGVGAMAGLIKQHLALSTFGANN